MNEPRATLATSAVASVLVVVTAGAVAAIAHADDARGGSIAMAASEPGAVLLLVGAVRAQRARDYSATEYVCSWTQGAAATSVVRVQHRAGVGTLVQVQPSVAAPGRTVSEPEQTSQPATVDPLSVSVVDGGPLDLLRRNYVLTVGPADASTAEVLAHRNDGTIAATFWIDRHTGLPVRRELFDNAGRLVRASAFVELHLGAGPSQLSMPAAPVTTPTPEITVNRAQLHELREAGWVLPPQLPGGMVLYDVRAQGVGAERVIHLSYSDGLAAVSVFVQNGRLDTNAVATWSRQHMGGRVYVHADGLGQRVTWNGRGRVYTVVGDAPSAAVVAVVTALPHGEHHRGVWGRMKHGAHRLGSWLNPFG